MADQAVFALTNLILIVQVARTASPASFGVFSLLYAATGLAVQLNRNLTGYPLGIGEVTLRRPGSAEREAAGAALVLGSGAGLVVLAALGIAAADIRTAVLLLGVATPMIFLQDTLRHVVMARQETLTAFKADLVWLAIQVAGVAVWSANGTLSPTIAVSAWLVGAAGSSFWLAVRTGTVPELSAVRRWHRRSRHHARGFGAEFVGQALPTQAAFWAFGVLVGFADVAAVRGAILLFAPIQTVMFGLTSALVPVGQRLAATSGTTAVVRLVRVTAAILVAGTVVLAAAVAVIPDSIGAHLLGETWDPARRLVPLIAIERLFAAITTALMIGLRSMSVRSAGVRARITTGLLVLAVGPAAALLAGAGGFAAVLAAAAAVGLAIWLRRWRVERAGSITDDTDLEFTTVERTSHAS